MAIGSLPAPAPGPTAAPQSAAPDAAGTARPAAPRFTLVAGERPTAVDPAAAARPAGPLSAAPAPAPAEPRSPVAGALARLLEDERQVDRGLRAAMAGQKLSAQELLTLQAQVIQYSQELEVVTRVVDKAAGAVKQTLQTQV